MVYESVHGTLKHFFFILKIFGLAPICFTSTSCKVDKCAVLWSFTVLGLLTTFGIYVITFKMVVKYSLIVEIIETLEQFFYSVISAIIVLFMIINNRKVVYLLKEFLLFDVKIKPRPKIKTTNSKIYFFTFFSSVTVFILVVLKHGIFFYFVKPITTTMVLYNTRSAVALFFYSLVLLQFCALALTLKQKFEIINHFLLSLNFSTKGNSRNAFKSSSQNVKWVSQVHNHLCDLSTALSEIFSVPIMLLTLAQVLILLSAAFSLVEFGFIKKGPIASPGTVGQDFTDVLIYFTLTILLISTSSQTMEEARKTGVIVHLLIANNDLSEELHFTAVHFSLQLMHSNVRFTACSLFVIDESLIHSVLAAVCPYLVIMVQFELEFKKYEQMHHDH